MSYTFLKPKTTNIWEETWNKVGSKWQFWVPLPLIFIFGFLPLVIIPIVYFMIVLAQVRASFWKEFAKVNGWQYKERIQPEIFSNLINMGDSIKETGLMFQEGNTRSISNEIEGILNNRHFRIFCYQFSIGSGKSRRVYYYTVFAFKFNGSFPHIYLNNKNNSWSITTGERVPLPVEFENKFSLSAPKKYEVEALEIFTPNVLMSLLDDKFSYDVEFVNQEILVFADGEINNFDQLEKRFNEALNLNDLMSEKLDKFKFEPIGNLSSTLK